MCFFSLSIRDLYCFADEEKLLKISFPQRLANFKNSHQLHNKTLKSYE